MRTKPFTSPHECLSLNRLMKKSATEPHRTNMPPVSFSMLMNTSNSPLAENAGRLMAQSNSGSAGSCSVTPVLSSCSWQLSVAVLSFSMRLRRISCRQSRTDLTSLSRESLSDCSIFRRYVVIIPLSSSEDRLSALLS